MKEYIAKVNGEYRLIDDNEVISGRIEVPSGAEEAICFDRGVIEFYKDNRTNFFDKVSERWEKCRGDHSKRTAVWQRSPSREYINKTTGEYRKTSEVVSGEQWIEIPKGENVAYKDPDDGSIYFTRLEMGYRDVELLWQRPTQPEALPFVDDDPSLDAEIEKVRQSTVADTLAARQSTYGSFEDVAHMTQELLDVMKQYGFDAMPKPHKEALHMICSKMARIVNGDHNHSDGWHDIGGYAKLIEDLID